MRKERKKIINGGSSILRKDGTIEPVNPKEVPAIANQCGAFVKLLETGIPHQVIA